MVLLCRSALALVTLSGLTVAGPARSAAQATPKLAPGTRVRVNSPALRPRVAVGFVIRASADTILFETDDRRALLVTTANLIRLDTSLGSSRQTIRGALIGSAIGLGGGLLLGIAVNSADDPFTGRSASEAIGSSVASGVVSGALIGALVGRMRRSDRWDAVALPGGRPVAGGTLGVHFDLTLRF